TPQPLGRALYSSSVPVLPHATIFGAAITITVKEVNVAPTISGVPSAATIDELSTLTFTATATDPDIPAQTLTFSLVGAPSGTSIDAASGAFTRTPTEAQGPGPLTFSA